MRRLALLLVALLALVYPLVVYFGIHHLGPALCALFLLLLLAVKIVLAPQRQPSDYLLLGGMLLFSGAVALTKSETLLRLYPVLMSLAMAALFALSLKAPESLIERFARRAGKSISANAKCYTRRLTGVWALLLLLNAGVALFTALFSSWQVWALYNGLLSYLIFVAVFVLELPIRYFYIRSKGA